MPCRLIDLMLHHRRHIALLATTTVLAACASPAPQY